MNRKFFISLLIGLIIVVGYLYLFVSDEAQKRKQSQKTEDQVQEEIKDIQAKIYDIRSQGTAEGIDTEIKKLRQEIMQASASFPRDIGITTLLRDISIIADSGGVQMLLFEPLEPINEGVYEEIPIKIRIRGSYKQIAGFLYGISNLEKVINVQEMKITGPINNSGVVMTETDIVITTYRILGGAS